MTIEQRSAGNAVDVEFTGIPELSKRGYHYLKENRMGEAAACFIRILDLDPENSYALVGLGDTARRSGHFREAITFYERCLQRHRENNYALFGLADCYKAQNHYRKAIEIWEHYLLQDDKNITILTRIADAYRKIRDFRHSKEVYLRVLELEKENPYALIGLGHLHYDFKDYVEALHYWESMFDRNRNNPDIRVLTAIGNCYRKLKTYQEGIPFFERALEQDMDNFYALFGLADCYRGMDMHKIALVYWHRILKNDPRNKVILTRTADAYRNIGETQQAMFYYKQALDIEFDLYASLGLAIIARMEGRYEEAIESLQGLIQYDPRNYRFYMELARCRIQQNQHLLALEVLQNFQRRGLRNLAVNELIEQLHSSSGNCPGEV